MAVTTKIPEEWLKVITKERKSYDGPNKYKVWMQLYRRAVDSIPVDQFGHNNTAYAKILVDFAKLQALTSEDEARNIFQVARNNVKHCSLVYVAWAQFELVHNNPAKCKKLLNKGKQFYAEPKYLLDMALENFANGNTQLIDEETEEHTFTELINKSTTKIEDTTDGVTRAASRKSDSSSGGYSSTDLSSPESSQLTATSGENCCSAAVVKPKSKGEIRSEPASVRVGKTVSSRSKNDQGLKSGSDMLQSCNNSLSYSGKQDSCSSTFSLSTRKTKYPGSSGSSESSDEMDTLPTLLRSKILASQKNGQDDVTKPKAAKATPQCKSLSNSKYTANSSSSKDHKLGHGFRRSTFNPLPQRGPIHVSDEPEDLEEDQDDEDSEGHRKVDSDKISPKEGEDFVDDVSPLRDVEECPSKNELWKPKSIFERGGQPNEKKTIEILDTITEETTSGNKKCEIDPGRIQEEQLNSESATAKPQPEKLSQGMESRQPRMVCGANLSRQKDRAPAPTPLVRNNEQRFDNSSSYPANQGHPITSAQSYYSRRHIAPQASHEVPAGVPVLPPFASNILIVNGKVYNKLNNIGKGGSSKVYSAFDGEKTCAIKYVNVEDADPTVIQSYINEITLLKRLQGHESIIKLYDWEMDDVGKVIKLVLEIGSIDLAGYLRKNPGKITRDFIKVCWKQILDAVQVVHDEGIVHTDLKPANFLLVQGNLKLIDFGIANAIQGDTTSFLRDSQIGTLNYMSPEALKDISQSLGPNENHKPIMKIGRASDVWSLGCILYMMVYGKTPFQHVSNHIKKLHCIMDPTFEINFPRIENPDLLDTMKGCLKRNPRERYTIPQLQNHPFLTGKTKVKASDVDCLLDYIMQIKQINSPTTLRSMAENMLDQFSSGGSLDKASVKSSQTSQDVENQYSSGRSSNVPLTQPPRRPQSQQQELTACQPSRQPFHSNISVNATQERKNNQYFAGSLGDYKENPRPKCLR